MILKSKPWLAFLLFLSLAHLFYFPTWNAGFVTDFTGLAERIEGGNFADILNCFGFPALQQVLNFFLYIFYQLFGTAPLPWYLIFTFMHALNAWLLLQVGQKIGQQLKIKDPYTVSFIASLFFLLSPYQTEVLVWRVCFNFLFSSAMILTALWYLTIWLENKHNRPLIIFHLSFLTALFTFELAFALPFISLCYLILWNASNGNNRATISDSLKTIAPQFGAIGAYFLLTKLTLGSWVGHYGPSVHLRFDLTESLANGFRYLSKFSFFTRYLEHGMKEKIFQWLDNPMLTYGLTVLLLLLIAFALIRFRALSNKAKVSLFFLLAFFIALLPIINLYFNYLLLIENDRYGYLASMFFCMTLTLVLSFLPRWLYFAASAAFLALSCVLLWNTNQHWKASTKVYYGLLNDFESYDQEEVYLLNLPDNLKGAPIFRDFSGQGKAFADALQYIRQKPYNGIIYEVAQYNMTRLSNGVKVEQKAPGQLLITFNQYGNWWWRKGQGASNFEIKQFKFTNQGQSYLLDLKEVSDNASFLYQLEDHFEEFPVE